jgi:phosphate transport system protein
MRLIDAHITRLQDLIRDMAKEVLTSLELIENFRGRETRNTLLELSHRLREAKARVDEAVLEVMVRYQPMASDLRFVRSVLEVSYDLYRISRYAYDIAVALDEAGVSLSECMDTAMRESMSIVREMVSLTIDSFLSRDAGNVERIKRMEEIVDSRYLDHFKNALTSRDKCTIPGLLLMRYLERIADHCSYISDSILFITRGPT